MTQYASRGRWPTGRMMAALQTVGVVVTVGVGVRVIVTVAVGVTVTVAVGVSGN